MLSLIICSRSTELLEKVSVNVAATIGVPYEIVAIDNAEGKYGICAAYNEGARRSRYDLLCFMHEDILFHTVGWGRIVEDILSDVNVGLVGVAGSRYLVKTPAPWWGGPSNTYRRNVLERYDGGSTEHVLQNPESEKRADVIAVDGLWFCARRDVWDLCPFDEQNFPHFHGYDIDFSMQVSRRFQVCVTFEILIEHSSRGSFSRAWLQAAIAFSRKWKSKLPASLDKLSAAETEFAENDALKKFCSWLITIGYDRDVTISYVLKNLLRAPMKKDSLWLLKKALFN